MKNRSLSGGTWKTHRARVGGTALWTSVIKL
jgi:hypothetical protein